MALVYFTGRVGMVDEHGLTGSKEVVVQMDDTDAATDTLAEQIATAQQALVEWVEAFDNVIDAMITSVDLTIPLISEAAGLKVTPGEQGLAEGANLKLTPLVVDPFRPNRVLPYFLPSATEGVFLPNFRDVDTADGALLFWIAKFNPSPAPPATIVISDREAIASIQSGRYATRRRSADG